MNSNTFPSVYWITGLSGAGKTTLSREFYKLLKSSTITAESLKKSLS